MDYIVLYRPGSKVLFILKNSGGNFTSVFQTFVGLGGYDLASAADRAFAFDFDGTGKIQSFGGVGGFNLVSSADQIFGFDYVGNSKQDHLVLFRPGTGIIWVEQNVNGTFSPMYL